jgi:spectinomycin phosphotransferase
MLEKPDLQDDVLIACLRNTYGLLVDQIAFLPLGADPNTAVYRAATGDRGSYFVKLRRGVFNEAAVALPRFLSDQGITQIIPPLETRTGQLWGHLDAFTVILYPFVEGQNGYEAALSDRQWHDFGTALKRFHTAAIPPALTQHIRRETYSSQAREQVKMFLSHLDENVIHDSVTRRLIAFLKTKHAAIHELVERADRGARALQTRAPEFIVCHSDIHAGNILIAGDDHFYIVDWDDPILALKERDLMFIGGGQGFVGHTAQEEATLFYQGYGETQVDPIALAYYRYERIIQDIAIFCEQLLLTDAGGDDREQSLRFLISNFEPGGTIEAAYSSAVV